MIISLMKKLQQIEDQRKAKGKRYPLWIILMIAILATMCGYESYSAMAEWGKNYEEEIKKELKCRIWKCPCASTFYNVLKKIDVNIVEKIIEEWMSEVLKYSPVFALDGKTLRGTRKTGGEFYHLISVFSHNQKATLYQMSVDSKSNEIPAATNLLNKVDLEGKICTMDALLTQKEIAKKIIEKKADYVMIVKDNQETLKEEIQCVLKGEEKFGNSFQQYYQTDKGHGRIEFREISVCSSEFIEWKGAKQVFKIEREITKKAITSFETVYGITSTLHSPEDLLSIVRGHWSIENQSHWVRDVVFDEDRSQVKNSNIAQIMAAFRNLAISCIHLFHSNHISKSCRFFASNVKAAFNIIFTSPSLLTYVKN